MDEAKTLLTAEQVEGVERLLVNDRDIIAFGTGLGKTYVALASFIGRRRLNPSINLHLVALVTKTAAGVWKSQIEQHTNLSFFHCGAETSRQEYDETPLKNTDVTIIEYSVIKKCPSYIERLYSDNNIVLVADEAHRLKNPESKVSELVAMLRNSAKCVWFLTATPMLNHITDLYYVVNFLFPGVLGSEISFLKTYTDQKKRFYRGHAVWEVVGYKNLEQLADKIKPYMLARFYDFNVKFHYHKAAFSQNEELVYLRAAMGYLTEDYKEFAARLPDLQLVVDNAVLPGSRDFNTYEYNQPLGMKESLLLDLLKELKKNNAAVIIYSHLKYSLARIRAVVEEHLFSNNVFQITGETSQQDRQKVEERFSEGDYLFMTGAGGESLNLKTSNNIILYNTPFSVGEFIQVVGRIIRMDSTFDCLNIHMLEIVETVDTYKRMLIEHNSERITKVISRSANLPQTVGETTKNLIIKMRKDLLWKRNRIRELQKAAMNVTI